MKFPKTIKSKAVFTKTGMDKTQTSFKIVPLKFFLSIEILLKFLFWYGVKLYCCIFLFDIFHIFKSYPWENFSI